MINKESGLIFQLFIAIIGGSFSLKTIQVSGIELLEGADQSLHPQSCCMLVMTGVKKADFYLVAQLSALLFYG